MNRQSPMLRDLRARAARILQTPIGQATRWVVITGAPSSGKTSVINELGRFGYEAVHDVSRQHIQEEMHAGNRSSHDVRTDPLVLQETILWKMVVSTGALDPERVILFDYALPDNVAFWELEGLAIPSEVWRSSLLYRYHRVFIFEPLPVQDDNVRTEDADYQARLTIELKRVYAALGYNALFVPAESLSNRVAVVKRCLEENQT